MTDIYPGATLISTPGFYARPTPNPSLVFSTIHTTANLASARNQAIYAAREGSQVTSTFWVDPNGAVVQSFADPLRQAPWANGVWQNPDLTNPRIAAARKANVNPNLRTLVSIENVSLEPGYPITAAQEATCGKIIAHYHVAAGVPISRETVIGHYQITAIDRANCPARNKAVIDRIVALAGGEDVTTIVDARMFLGADGKPAPRTISFAAGTYTGYALSGAKKTVTLAAGSSAPADAVCFITQIPDKDPHAGDWLRFTAGVFDDHYIRQTVPGISVPPDPPLNPYNQADVDAAAKDAADAVAAASAAKAAEF